MHIVEEVKSKAPFALPGLGQRIRVLRKQIGMSARELADLTDFHISSVLMWERELPNRTPGIEKVKRIVEVLHIKGASHPYHQSKQRGHLLEYLVWGD